ncbi:cytidine deaminase [Westerdykella ornata]|uniref:Cytidine deaminase n=1 Tax=Westerdykella ornata TaxID=318751 RepID=A0A6A6JXC1_WESOR|nr:cytidine deaminase [Westerdykella ornata]KAF2281271.1 cytidine deaminase [Westerdykella ornata]
MSTEIPSIQLPQAEGGEEKIHGLTHTEISNLRATSLKARDFAYCPYSLFRVGAALLIRSSNPGIFDHIIRGANVENASYPVGTCAERVAMGHAIASGYRKADFKAIGVATDQLDFCSPCGMCRQFLREFLDLDTPIFMFNREGEYEVKTMGQLLPLSFGPEALPPREMLEGQRK